MFSGKKILPMIGAVVIMISGPAWSAAPETNMSGMFFDPGHSGEGFMIEMLPGESALVYWFTYDRDGAQRWFIGTGVADSASITVDQWFSTRGGVFGSGYDPDAVELIPSGSARFVYSDCNRMTVDYEIDGLAGRQELVRLTGVADLGCAGGNSHYSGISGSYFDPQRVGEGIVMQVYEHGSVLLVWFTYDHAGQQVWLIGTGSVTGTEVRLDDMLSTRGGRFGADFDPSLVERLHWGGARLAVQCQSLKLEYGARDPALGSGSLDMTRLTSLAGLECDPGTTHLLTPVPCGDEPRSRLTTANLDQKSVGFLTFNSDYAPARDCEPARHALNGRISFSYAEMQVSDPNVTRADFTRGLFPQVSVDLVTVGDYVVPVQPQVLEDRSGSAYNIVFSNGRIWSEAGDGGRSRVGLPVTLAGKQWNEAKNGMLTFLFDGQDISAPRFQFTQETVPWNRYDYWGVASASFTPGEHPDAYRAERAFRRELAMRLPQQPLSDLAQQGGQQALADFNRGLAASEISQTGIIKDSVLYLQPAETRYGLYPWAEEMRHGAFSVTKTAAGLLLMLRLAEKYGEAVFAERIADHVNVTADHDGWDQVTFGDALSMATGIGDRFPDPDAPVTFADENDTSNPTWQEFNLAGSMEGRLAAAFRYRNYPWQPGEVMRYNSAHTVVLAAALSHYLQQREGADADLLEFLNREVYQPLGIRWLPAMRIRYLDGRRGLTPLGWGLLPSAHDIARIAELLQNRGAFGGVQILHRQRTIDALRLEGSPALRSHGQFAQLDSGNWVPVSYRDAFWSFPVSSRCTAVASVMQGYGGNSVALLPSGVSVFRFADHEVYDDGALAVTAERIRPSC